MPAAPAFVILFNRHLYQELLQLLLRNRNLPEQRNAAQAKRPCFAQAMDLGRTPIPASGSPRCLQRLCS